MPSSKDFFVRPHPLRVFVVACLALTSAARAQTSTSQPAATSKKPTLAVLPFIAITGDAAEKDLAVRMRFAVSQKLSTDSNASVASGVFERMDNVEVDNICSALEISFAGRLMPGDADLKKLMGSLGTQFTIAGGVKGRQLVLALYQDNVHVKTTTVDIPPDVQSPKLAVEKILTELTGTAFARIRDAEVDHSDARAEARFAARANLVPDPGFELARDDATKTALNWQAILQDTHYAPPLLTDAEAAALDADRVAIVPKSIAGKTEGLCLMMRMSAGVAEYNGLACESTWVPVEAGKKYRFAGHYRSDGPSVRVFLKGFAEKPDQFGDKNDPETSRREFYRAQVLPRVQNGGWELIEMDFTPSTLKPTDPKIQWVRVDLFIYSKSGNVWFDDITLKKLDE